MAVWGLGRGPHRHARLYKHMCTCLPFSRADTFYPATGSRLAEMLNVFHIGLCLRTGTRTWVSLSFTAAAQLSPGGMGTV